MPKKKLHCMSVFCGFGGKIRSIIGQKTHDISIISLARNELKMAHIYDVGSKDIQTVMGRYVAIEKMKIALGDRVIDFGCGPGNLDFDIADIVGEEGYVFGFDPLPLSLPDCIDVARQKITEKYMKIVKFELGKAEDVPKSAGTDYDHAVMSCMIHWTRRDEALDQGFMVLGKGDASAFQRYLETLSTRGERSKREFCHRGLIGSLALDRAYQTIPQRLNSKATLPKLGLSTYRAR